MLKVCVLTFAAVLTLATAASPSGVGKVPVPASAPAAPGAAQGIIVVDGIPGESRAKPGAIDLKTVSAVDCAAAPATAAAPKSAAAQQSTRAVTSPRDAASGLPTGKRQHKPFVITKELDKASPLLAKAAAGGTLIPRATLVLGGITYELEGILIGMHQPGGAGGAKPTETLTLNFAKCTRK